MRAFTAVVGLAPKMECRGDGLIFYSIFLSLHFFQSNKVVPFSTASPFPMPSKRDSDRSQSPRKRTKYKESKGHRYDRKIRRAKTKARSGKASYSSPGNNFNSISLKELDLFQWSKWRFCKQDYWINPFVDVTPRIDYRSTSKEEFIAKYEEPNLPVVITHLTDEWPAQKHWTEKVKQVEGEKVKI